MGGKCFAQSFTDIFDINAPKRIELSRRSRNFMKKDVTKVDKISRKDKMLQIKSLLKRGNFVNIKEILMVHLRPSALLLPLCITA